jgi:beta-galactosidase
MKLGVCYYPEQWPQNRWESDIKSMHDLGLSIVRIGEFAWSKIEPRNGQFDLCWLDDFVDLVSKEGLQVVLGTPTAAPPHWLVQKHPEILQVDASGRIRKPGSRRHYCVNNNIYGIYVEKIVRVLAEHFSQHPSIIGWQIDNELGNHHTGLCYCNSCIQKFQDWLKQKYKDLNSLNMAWGTAFWSQDYSEWSQIQPPNGMVTEANPSQRLDYARFSTEAYRKFIELQAETICSNSKNQFVTTNFSLVDTELNFAELAKDLDFVSCNSYPTGYQEMVAPELYGVDQERPKFAYDVGDPYVTDYYHTKARGLSPRPFWVMEQQVGQINWSLSNSSVRGGTPRLWTWHAAASGAEAILYFRWRAALMGQEQMHSGLLNHDGSTSIAFDDLSELKEEIPVMQQFLLSPLKSNVAILVDQEDAWAIDFQAHRKDFSCQRLEFLYFITLKKLGMNVDIVSYNADLSDYRLILAPTIHVVSDEKIKKLESYVARGGTLLAGIRSGFKNDFNQVVDLSLPGLLRPLVGGKIVQWQSLPDEIAFQIKSNLPGVGGKAARWIEAIVPDGVETVQVLATYSDGPLSEKSCFIRHSYGAGDVYYLAWYPDEIQMMGILKYLIDQVEIGPVVDIPAGVIYIKRGKNQILLNFNEKEKTILFDEQKIPVPARDFRIIIRD